MEISLTNMWIDTFIDIVQSIAIIVLAFTMIIHMHRHH